MGKNLVQKDFRKERAALQAAQAQRSLRARRRALIALDKGSETEGTVENIISADDEFKVAGKLIVDYADGCKIGGRYENGEFIKGV